MFSHRLLSSHMIRSVAGLVLAMFAVPGLHAQSTTAPTASMDPAEMDRIWQKASSKYDGPRNTILKEVDSVDSQGPFRADWDSLQKYETPQWFRDAKFGIFIHWGVYAVPAFGSEWYPRNMYEPQFPAYKHHVETYGPLDKFGYKDFIPMIKAERYDPAAWAELFRKSGAKYVVPVAEHHDGFAMYDSGLSDWTAVKMGPRRDLIGDLGKAVRNAGLHFGVSSHRVEHDFFLGSGRVIPSDVNDPQYAAFYGPGHIYMMPKPGVPLEGDFTYASQAWANDWLARSAELVQKYHPDIVYFDWWIGHAAIRPALAQFAAYYYNSSLKYGDHVGVINYKDYAMQEHSAVLDLERGQLADIRELPWQTDTSVSNRSWGFINNDTFKTPQFVISQLVDIVSKNGNLLLNIGPRADGTIPDEVQKVLLEVGTWLNVNGDAIYGTRPWRAYGEGPTKAAAGSFHDTEVTRFTPEDFRFTTKGDALYAIGLAWPTKGEAVIRSLALTQGSKPVQSVALLGGDEKLKFEQRADGLHVQLPGQSPAKYAYALRIAF
jgi:alpha-L-fucosidase